MLAALSGRGHLVHTGFCILCGSREESGAETTAVTFFPLTAEEIDRYVATGEPMDKAGAYGVQGLGALLVQRVDGDFYNVVGLPIARVARLLRQFPSGG